MPCYGLFVCYHDDPKTELPVMCNQSLYIAVIAVFLTSLFHKAKPKLSYFDV